MRKLITYSIFLADLDVNKSFQWILSRSSACVKCVASGKTKHKYGDFSHTSSQKPIQAISSESTHSRQ